MVWVIVGVSLGAVALAAIGYFAFGAVRAVKALLKDVAGASELLAGASAPMQAGLAGLQSGNGSRRGSAPADR